MNTFLKHRYLKMNTGKPARFPELTQFDTLKRLITVPADI